MEQKDMIRIVFLSREFPLAWILEEFKNAFSWSDKRENRKQVFTHRKKVNGAAHF